MPEIFEMQAEDHLVVDHAISVMRTNNPSESFQVVGPVFRPISKS